MKLVSRIAGGRRRTWGAWMLGGAIGLVALGWPGAPPPLSVSGAAETEGAAGEPAEAPAFEREVFVVYSVNNLGYVDTCG